VFIKLSDLFPEQARALAAAPQPAEQRCKIPWTGNPRQLLDFFRYAFIPDADQATAEKYFALKSSRNKTIPRATPQLKTRLPNNQLRYLFDKAQELYLLNMRKQTTELARLCLDRNGQSLDAAKLFKKRLGEVSSAAKKKIDAKLFEINNTPK